MPCHASLAPDILFNGASMEVKSTLKVVNLSEIKGATGVIPGQHFKRMIGCPEIPTDRLRVGHAKYTPGSIE